MLNMLGFLSLSVMSKSSVARRRWWTDGDRKYCGRHCICGTGWKQY